MFKFSGKVLQNQPNYQKKPQRPQHHFSYKVVGFSRAARPCASGTCLFRLINTQNGVLRAHTPPPPIAALLLLSSSANQLNSVRHSQSREAYLYVNGGEL
jgi:hypothetical protein